MSKQSRIQETGLSKQSRTQQSGLSKQVRTQQSGLTNSDGTFKRSMEKPLKMLDSGALRTLIIGNKLVKI